MITKLEKHNNHQVSIHLCKPGRVHYAALRCKDCDTHIQWLNKTEADKINEIIDPHTYWLGFDKGFVSDE